jgi:predicted PurR-regulated permease PerM
MAKSTTNNVELVKQSIDVYITLALISLFAYVSFTFVAPFISIILWAAILAVAINPLYLKLTGALFESNKLASIFISLLGVLFLLVPTYIIVQSAFESSKELLDGLKDGSVTIPPPRETIKDWPLIGSKLYSFWNEAYMNLQDTLSAYQELLKELASKLFNFTKALLGGVLQFTLSIIVASMFLAFAQPLSGTLKKVAKRLDGKQGESFVDMSVSTIRNVSKGVLGIAVMQGILAYIGFFFVGLPLAGIWGAATIALSMIQLPMLVMIPAIIYVWGAKTTMAALIFTAYMIPVMLSDNILKPIVMAKGLATPMFIIFMGVIGGTMSLGMLGLFIGPVILAIFYELVRLWIGEAD